MVIAVLLTGFSCAFAVSMPDNATFDDGTPYGMGLLSSGVLTSYLAMLGAFEVSDYTNPESTVFFVVFLFLIVVIMLNLLIALMADTFERVMESWVFESCPTLGGEGRGSLGQAAMGLLKFSLSGSLVPHH